MGLEQGCGKGQTPLLRGVWGLLLLSPQAMESGMGPTAALATSAPQNPHQTPSCRLEMLSKAG